MIDDLVSIVMPAYNAAATIERSIVSVQDQDHRQWELLVVDDCSRDNTREIVSRVASQDARVRYIRQERNSGSGAARARALKEARGRYLAFLDADDLWLPGKLTRQLQCLTQSQSGFCFTAYRRFSDDPTSPGRMIPVPAQLAYREALGNTAIATSTVLLDRSRVARIEIRDVYHDDLVLWLSIMRQGVVAHGLDEDWVRYRVARGSKSHNRMRMARMVWHTYREVEGMGIAHSAWCFVQYATRAWLKHARF
jgi:teichuronic acid biosynthesis glycosyltransferase TuaG